MALSISAAVLLGIIVFALLKGGYVRVGSMLTCSLFDRTAPAPWQRAPYGADAPSEPAGYRPVSS